MPHRPTRQAPYRYGVTYLRRGGTTLETVGADREQEARQQYDKIAAHVATLSADLREAQPFGSAKLLTSTRDTLDHICAGCLAIICDNEGCLTWHGLPFCGTCAQRIEDE